MDIHEGHLMTTRRMAALPLFQLETSGPGSPALCLAAARLSNDNHHAPLVALACDGFQDPGQLLELG